jgi:serine/threonine-protein kinase CLA4
VSTQSPSAPRKLPITIATDLENLIGIPASSSPPTEQDGPVLETSRRHSSWLAACVLLLAEFIDDSSDPCALFADLQEIAQGNSGSVYSACATPTITLQFRPPTPTSLAFVIFPKEDDEDNEGLVQSKRGLVAIKCIQLLRGHTEKLVDLWRELELARALRHANALRMEQLYDDVARFGCCWQGGQVSPGGSGGW